MKIFNRNKETCNGFLSQKEREDYDIGSRYPDPPVIYSRLPIASDPEKDAELYFRNMVMGATFTRPFNDHAAVGNDNVLVFGGAATGKTNNYIMPNILQMNASYIITDPFGEMARRTGKVLRSHGYRIQIFNLRDMEHSNRYNPLAYVKNDTDVTELVDALIRVTDPNGEAGCYEDSEKKLLSACIFYFKDFCENEQAKNFKGLMDMVCAAADGSRNSAFARLFEKLPRKSAAREYYEAFKQEAGSPLQEACYPFKSVIALTTRLQLLFRPDIANLTSSDDLHLEKIGDDKTALFIIPSRTDSSCNILASLLYAQALNVLYHHADEKLSTTGKRMLKVPVRLMLDEFPNLPAIPGLVMKMPSMQHYGISANICIQTVSQLKQMYPGDGMDSWQNMVGNCSGIVFLGSQDIESLDYFAEKLGCCHMKKSGGKGIAIKHAGRDVMTRDELSRMPSDECIIRVQNYRPVRDKKYQCKNHPYYPQTADADKANIFAYEEMAEYRMPEKINEKTLA